MQGACTPAVDWAFVAEALDGLPQPVIREFMVGALDDARQALAELQSVSLPDAARGELAHRLKGSARTFGLVRVGEAAAAIEQAIRGGRDLEPALGRYAAAVEATAAHLAAA